MLLIDKNIIKNCGTIVTGCYIMDFSSPSILQILPTARIICKNITTRILCLRFFLIRKFALKITNKIIIFATKFDYYPIRGGCDIIVQRVNGGQGIQNSGQWL
jgi:hypothetical protein